MIPGLETPSIKEFYAGQSVLITGGTGFMGKVLIEKLLRSCPGVVKIYVLLRRKGGKTLAERLKDISSTALFAKLMTESPNDFANKVIPIAGDISEVDLGLSSDDRKTLVNNVSIIFHNAASVRFFDPMPVNVFMNTRGTRDLLKLAEEIKHLKVLLHVSTAYVNTDRNPITEEIFPPHADWRETIKVCETVDEYTLKLLTPKYIGPLPNTYAFSKNLSEHIMNEKQGKLPIVIFRPSVVISSSFDPIAGWIDNFNGPIALSVACGKGIVNACYVDPTNPLSNVSVDIAIRAMIVAAWQCGIKKVKTGQKIPVIHCCNAGVNITIGEYNVIGMNALHETPFDNILWPPTCILTKNKINYYLRVIFLHLLPALLVDGILKLYGKKAMLFKLQRKIYVTNMMVSYYTMNWWKFVNENFVSMCNQVPAHEKEDFHYIFENVDVLDYVRKGQIANRRYLLKESDDNLDQAKTHLKRMVFVSIIAKILIWGLMIWTVARAVVYQTSKS